MSLYATMTLAATRLLPSAEEIPFDDKGYTTIDPIFPPWKEPVSYTHLRAHETSRAISYGGFSL